MSTLTWQPYRSKGTAVRGLNVGNMAALRVWREYGCSNLASKQWGMAALTRIRQKVGVLCGVAALTQQPNGWWELGWSDRLAEV